MLIRPALLAAFASLVLAPSALAAASSDITTPADPVHTFYGATQSVGDNVAVEGTATDFPGNADVICYPTYGYLPVTLADNVPVSGGHFAATVDLTAAPFSCILRAVPHGTSPASAAERAPFAGPRVLPTFYEGYTTASGDLNDYAYTFPGTRGNFFVNSPADQGASWSNLADPATLEPAPTTLAGNVFGLFASDGGYQPPTRSEIEVDGAAAYTPYGSAWIPGAPSPLGSTPGTPAITIIDESFDPATGDTTVVTSEPIVKCSPQSDWDSNWNHYSTSCTRLVRTGVVLERTLTTGADGRTLGVSDQWRSPGPQAHKIDVLYDNRFYGNQAGPSISDIHPTSGFRFPGDTTFNDYADGATVTLPAGAGTFFYKGDRSEPDSGGALPQGALSYSDAPDSMRFIGSDLDAYGFPEWTMGYVRTVPARGSATLSFQLAQASGQPELQTFANAFESQFPRPASGGTTTVTPGTQASTNQPVLAAAGLRVGKPSARWSGSRIVLDTGDVATCSGGTGSCSFGVTATIARKDAHSARNAAKRVTIGKAKATVAAGKSKHLTLKLSKRWTKLLVRKRKLKVAIVVTRKSQAAKAASSRRTVTFKAPKRRHRR
jgi:hypothetical protein